MYPCPEYPYPHRYTIRGVYTDSPLVYRTLDQLPRVSAFLFTRWMQEAADMVGVGGMAALCGDEQKLPTMMRNLVGQTNPEVVDSHKDSSMQICRLAAATARLWADISSGIYVFRFEHRVDMSLLVIADLPESELPPS